MDPITLIVTALAAGAASALQDGASAVVKDAYARLKALVSKRFACRPRGSWCWLSMKLLRRHGRCRWPRSCLRWAQTVIMILWQQRRR